MSDNVIDIKTGLTIREESEARKDAERKFEEFRKETESEHKKRCLENLDRIKRLIMEEKIEGFIAIGRNPDNGLMFSADMINHEISDASTYLGYAGQMENMKLQVLDRSLEGPQMDSRGEYFLIDFEADGGEM